MFVISTWTLEDFFLVNTIFVASLKTDNTQTRYFLCFVISNNIIQLPYSISRLVKFISNAMRCRQRFQINLPSNFRLKTSERWENFSNLNSLRPIEVEWIFNQNVCACLRDAIDTCDSSFFILNSIAILNIIFKEELSLKIFFFDQKSMEINNNLNLESSDK